MAVYTEWMKLNVNDIMLDKLNPRLQSRLIIDLERYTEDEIQYILMFYLIATDQVDDLITDIIQNVEVAKELLENDVILVQKNKYNYVVKEGNRRICSLKLIFNNSLMDKLLNFVEKTEILKEVNDIYDKFLKSISTIRRVLLGIDVESNSLKKLSSVECKVYGNDEESNHTLNLILRRLHIYQKREWYSADRQLFEYVIIMEELKKGAADINEAIEKALAADRESAVNNTRQKSKMKKMFEQSNFYHYLLNRIGLYEDREMSARMEYLIKKNPLPLCETLLTRLKADYNIQLYYDMDVYDRENNCFKYILVQKDGKIIVKELDSFVDELVKSILISRDKPISHEKYKNKKSFEELFEDIINKYTFNDPINGEKKERNIEIWQTQEFDYSKFKSQYFGDEIPVIYYNDQIQLSFLPNIPGDWKFELKNEILNVLVKEPKIPTIVQKISNVYVNREYNFDQLCSFKNSFNEEKGLEPLHFPKVDKSDAVDINTKLNTISFRSPGLYNIIWGIRDKKTKKECTHSFTILAEEYKLQPLTKKGVFQINYISSYFNKTELNIADDISKFIFEINSVMNDTRIEMIFVASFRSLVELVCNDIIKRLNIPCETSNLGPKYDKIMKYALKKENFLDIVKVKCSPDQYQVVSSFTKQVSTDINKDGFISFLNLSTHSTGRFTDKKMVMDRKIFVEYLINYLDFLNDHDDIKYNDH